MTMTEDTDVDYSVNTGSWCLCRHYAQPLVPSLPGQSQFEGLVMHSHDYRHPEVFTDMNVLCLGAGPSGVDISIEMAPFAKQVTQISCSLGLGGYKLPTDYSDCILCQMDYFFPSLGIYRDDTLHQASNM